MKELLRSIFKNSDELIWAPKLVVFRSLLSIVNLDNDEILIQVRETKVEGLYSFFNYMDIYRLDSTLYHSNQILNEITGEDR